jgi:hypothetical protein
MFSYEHDLPDPKPTRPVYHLPRPVKRQLERYKAHAQRMHRVGDFQRMRTFCVAHDDLFLRTIRGEL